MSAIVIAGLLLASAAARAEDQPQCLSVERIVAPLVLETGGEIDVRVRLTTFLCALPNDHGAGTTANLAIALQPGLEATARPIAYSDLEVMDASRAHAVEITIRIKARKGIDLGQYRVPAVVNYDAIDEHGRTVHESLAFAIPVKVEGPSLSHPTHGGQRSGLRNALTVTGEVLLGIVIWPVWMVTCLITGGCSSC